MSISARLILDGLKSGDSVSLNGVCLTATGLDRGGFTVEATEQTLAVSTVKDWQVGRRVNLERALRVGDRLGGHFVQGHVDGVGRVTRVKYLKGSVVLQVTAPPNLRHMIIPKGSVAVDGVGLTIAERHAQVFSVNLVPYTLEHTTLGELKPGDEVNLESDLILRWLADRFPENEISFAPADGSALPGEFHLED